jgi:hypothetical protein
MKFEKFKILTGETEFFINPTYVCLLRPATEEGGTTIVTHHGEYHVDEDIEKVGPKFDFLVRFTNLKSDKVFYVNPSFVAEIVSKDESQSTIITHHGEYTIGMGLDDVAGYLDEGLAKLS